MTDLPQSELRSLLTTQKYRLATALNNFYNADSKNPAAGDAAAIEIAQAIRVLVHGDEALLRQLDPGFEDRSIAFGPKLVKQVPDVELSPGNFSQTRGVPQDVVLVGDRVRYDRKKPTSSAARASLRDWSQVCWNSGANSIANSEIVLGSRIKMAALMWTVADIRTIAKRSNKVRCFSANSLAISRKWDIWQLSLATNSKPSLQRILEKSQMKLKILKEREEYTSVI